MKERNITISKELVFLLSSVVFTILMGTISGSSGRSAFALGSDDTKQDIVSEKNCSGSTINSCTSDILQQLTITGSLDSFARQSTFSSSFCSDTNCANIAINLGGISESVNTDLQQTINQDNGREGLNCAGGSGCFNSASDNAAISNSENSAINTQIHQTNGCTDSDCFNSASDNAAISNGENSAINTQIRQTNGCTDSSCNNKVEDQTSVGTDDTQVNDQINQQNLCISGSSCDNTAQDTGNANYKNTQKNICVGGSQCSNTGVDTTNICVNGAKCLNGGSDSKIISDGEQCHNSGTGRMICAAGYVITSGSVVNQNQN
jgi:hypothetical protein